MSVHVFQRHLLGSPAEPDAPDRGWRTFGASPGSTVRDSEPHWPVRTADLERPPRLAGAERVEDVLTSRNFDRLGRAFWRRDDRFRYSLWGISGPDPTGRWRWRVVTHTLDFDEAAFRAIAGHPEALIRLRLPGTRPPEPHPSGARVPGDRGPGTGAPGTRPSGESPHGPAAAWFRELATSAFERPGEVLDPVVVPAGSATTRAFERARLAELSRLGRLLEEALGSRAAVEDRLALLLESLARTRSGQRIEHVVLPDGLPGAELALRLAWTSLPLPERAGVTFATEVRRSAQGTLRHVLAVLPGEEWESTVPARALHVGEDGPRAAAETAPGRRLWARTVSRGGPGLEELARRMELRDLRILDRDDLAAEAEEAAWRESWRRDPGPALARRLLALEVERKRSGRSARLRAAGLLLARATAAGDGEGERGDPAARAERLWSAVEEQPAQARRLPASGALRALSRGSPLDRTTGGFLGIALLTDSVSCKSITTIDLDRFMRCVPDLVGDPRGAFTAAAWGAEMLLSDADDGGETPPHSRSPRDTAPPPEPGPRGERRAPAPLRARAAREALERGLAAVGGSGLAKLLARLRELPLPGRRGGETAGRALGLALARIPGPDATAHPDPRAAIGGSEAAPATGAPPSGLDPEVEAARTLLEWALPAYERHGRPALRDALAHPAALRAVLRGADAGELTSYLTAVDPPPAGVAAEVRALLAEGSRSGIDAVLRALGALEGAGMPPGTVEELIHDTLRSLLAGGREGRLEAESWALFAGRLDAGGERWLGLADALMEAEGERRTGLATPLARALLRRAARRGGVEPPGAEALLRLLWLEDGRRGRDTVRAFAETGPGARVLLASLLRHRPPLGVWARIRSGLEEARAAEVPGVVGSGADGRRRDPGGPPTALGDPSEPGELLLVGAE